MNLYALVFFYGLENLRELIWRLFSTDFERSPVAPPSRECRNPNSTTIIKCTLWSSVVTSANASNKGQMREKFEVVIAGSNGYTSASFVTPSVEGAAAGNKMVKERMKWRGWWAVSGAVGWLLF